MSRIGKRSSAGCSRECLDVTNNLVEGMPSECFEYNSPLKLNIEDIQIHLRAEILVEAIALAVYAMTISLCWRLLLDEVQLPPSPKSPVENGHSRTLQYWIPCSVGFEPPPTACHRFCYCFREESQ